MRSHHAASTVPAYGIVTPQWEIELARQRPRIAELFHDAVMQDGWDGSVARDVSDPLMVRGLRRRTGTGYIRARSMHEGTDNGNQEARYSHSVGAMVETPAVDEAPVLEAGTKRGSHRIRRGIDRAYRRRGTARLHGIGSARSIGATVSYQPAERLTHRPLRYRHADEEPAPSEGRGRHPRLFCVVISKAVDGGPEGQPFRR